MGSSNWTPLFTALPEISRCFIRQVTDSDTEELARSGRSSSSGAWNPFSQFDTVPGIRLNHSSIPALGNPFASRKTLNFAPNDILTVSFPHQSNTAYLPSAKNIQPSYDLEMNALWTSGFRLIDNQVMLKFQFSLRHSYLIGIGGTYHIFWRFFSQKSEKTGTFPESPRLTLWKQQEKKKTSGTRNYESKIRKKKGGMGDDNGKVAEGGAFYFRHRNDGLRNH